jgi:hypothetical protein
MAQAIPRDKVLSVLQRRYDYQSAQVVLKRAVEAAKLSERDQYTSEELHSIGQGLQQVGDRLDAVLAELTALSGPAPMTAASVVEVERPPRAVPEVFRDRSAKEATPAGELAVSHAERATDAAPIEGAEAETVDVATSEEPESSGEESSESESTDAKPRSGRRRR